jgi:triacylglycerol lipase
MMNLVFASGFLVPQAVLRHDYFRDLPQRYPDALFASVNVLGSIADRAGQLAAAISSKFPAGDIHIVAHSMGGLDSRYLLTKNLNNLASRVVSLSTVATPHWGSPVADLLTGQVAPPLLSALAEKALAQLSKEFPLLEKKAGALYDLTTASAHQFNRDFLATAGVSYYPYMGNGHGSAVLIPTHLLIRLRGATPPEQDNDGVVSVASASWPGALIEPPWPTDHFGEIGYDLDAPGFKTPFDYLGAFDRVVARALATPSRKPT